MACGLRPAAWKTESLEGIAWWGVKEWEKGWLILGGCRWYFYQRRAVPCLVCDVYKTINKQICLSWDTAALPRSDILLDSFRLLHNLGSFSSLSLSLSLFLIFQLFQTLLLNNQKSSSTDIHSFTNSTESSVFDLQRIDSPVSSRGNRKRRHSYSLLSHAAHTLYEIVRQIIFEYQQSNTFLGQCPRQHGSTYFRHFSTIWCNRSGTILTIWKSLQFCPFLTIFSCTSKRA